MEEYMKKIYLVLGLALLVLSGCGQIALEVERLEKDIIDQIRGTSFEFLEEDDIVDTEEGDILFYNKIQYDHNELRTFQDVELKYSYDEDKKEWILDDFIKKLDHFEPLEDALEMQAGLRTQLGFEDEVLIGDEYLDIGDENISISQLESTFEGNNYSDYTYEVVYDNGVVNAKALYRISFLFVDSRGEWILKENKQIEDFVIESSVSFDDDQELAALVTEFLIHHQKGALDLIGDDSKMEFKLSVRDEDIIYKSLTDMTLESLQESFIDLKLVKTGGLVDVETSLRVFLELDEFSRGWKISQVKTLVNTTSVRLSEIFIGNWEGYFKTRNNKHKATLSITGIIGDGSRLDGIMSFGSSDTYVVEDSSYIILGGFVEDELLIECSEWIVQPKGVLAHTLHFDDIKFAQGKIEINGHMTWMKTDDYKAEFVKSIEGI